jgi:Rps23 Pro-64 3,4-dihydroxylase Tpa1-like proline 4-hydroxylase
MPPYLVLRDFLDEATVAGLLDYALSRQSDFAPTRLGSKAVDPAFRVSTGLRELGGYRRILKAKILGLVPSLISQLQVTPFDTPKLETELVAHGDGAFYKRHVDTRTARHGEAHDLRVLSGVYYFHAEPKAFTGGALRLYALGGTKGENFVDIEPVNNSLLVFPSWAPHEVMPVSCPSKRFIDSRFAINCWLRRQKLAASILPHGAGEDNAFP